MMRKAYHRDPLLVIRESWRRQGAASAKHCAEQQAERQHEPAFDEDRRRGTESVGRVTRQRDAGRDARADASAAIVTVRYRP